MPAAQNIEVQREREREREREGKILSKKFQYVQVCCMSEDNSLRFWR